MGTQTDRKQLHIMIFPLMAQGHTIPLVDMAKFMTACGVKVTILTTPQNAPGLSKSIETPKNDIAIKVIKFPTEESGLPQGFEILNLVTSDETHSKFFNALSMFQQPLEQVLLETRPECPCSRHAFYLM